MGIFKKADAAIRAAGLGDTMDALIAAGYTVTPDIDGDDWESFEAAPAIVVTRKHRIIPTYAVIRPDAGIEVWSRDTADINIEPLAETPNKMPHGDPYVVDFDRFTALLIQFLTESE